MKRSTTWGWVVAAAAFAGLGGCAAPVRPPVVPAGPPAEHVTPRDPGGPVELWGAWLEELSSEAFLPRLAQARGLAATGDLEAVLELLDAAEAELPPEPALRGARAGLLFEMGFPRAAELELERALALAPDDGDLWWELALVRSHLGLPTKADEARKRARTLAAR